MSEQKKITLIGAGLVGSLASLFLAKRGYEIDIFEKRTDLRQRQNLIVGEGRSINLAISVRGIHALKLMGLDEEVLKFAIPMRGRMLHAADGSLTFQSYGNGPKDAINSLSRSWLNGFLMDQADKTGKVKIHFDKELTGIDFEQRSMTFKDGEVGAYSMLIGTDGSASVIRNTMQARKMTEVTSEELSHSYKEFVMLPKSPGIHQMEPNALHIWPRGNFMMIALPNFDGSFTCTLFLPTQGDLSFASLNDKVQVEQVFTRQFPDFAGLVPDYLEQFFIHPTGRMFTVKTQNWSPPRFEKDVVLIGDASHAIVPFFGQGMNCGFEDCEVMDREWDEYSTFGFGGFNRLRKVNTDAIADMAVENFVEMSAKVADPHFLFQKAVEKKLQELFPKDYVSRYSLVSFSRVPYSTAQKVGEIQKGILADLCQGKTSIEEISMEKAKALIDFNLSSTMMDPIIREALS